MQRKFTAIGVISSILLGFTAWTSAQSSGTTRQHGAGLEIPERSFRLFVRDSKDIDGDVIRIELVDRTAPNNRKLLADRLKLEGNYGEAIEFSIAQPVDARLIITALQDSNDPQQRGQSGVSMRLRLEDTLGGLVWENDYRQFSRSATINLQLDTWVFHDRIRTAEQLRQGLQEAPAEVRDAIALGLNNPVVAAALTNLGDASYGHAGTRPGGWRSGTWKCNLFVSDALRNAGLQPPLGPPDANGQRWPLRAGTLGDDDQIIQGLPVNSGAPRPGDVVAAPLTNPGPGASGHSGIVLAVIPARDGYPQTVLVIQAGLDAVVITPMAISFPQPKYGNPVFRTPNRSTSP